IWLLLDAVDIEGAEDAEEEDDDRDVDQDDEGNRDNGDNEDEDDEDDEDKDKESIRLQIDNGGLRADTDRTIDLDSVLGQDQYTSLESPQDLDYLESVLGAGLEPNNDGNHMSISALTEKRGPAPPTTYLLFCSIGDPEVHPYIPDRLPLYPYPYWASLGRLPLDARGPATTPIARSTEVYIQGRLASYGLPAGPSLSRGLQYGSLPGDGYSGHIRLPGHPPTPNVQLGASYRPRLHQGQSHQQPGGLVVPDGARERPIGLLLPPASEGLGAAAP
ncbi:hypothetical protein V491_04418, partial [Pseudogymnoascus sp. VKM F-3775]